MYTKHTILCTIDQLTDRRPTILLMPSSNHVGNGSVTVRLTNGETPTAVLGDAGKPRADDGPGGCSQCLKNVSTAIVAGLENTFYR